MATNGPDVLRGSDAADRIDGMRGADVIFGFDAERTGPRVGQIVAERVAGGPGGGLDGAVFAGSAPGRPDDLYIVRKDVGSIVRIDPASGRRERFLDIPDDELGGAGEEGLLGFACHPDFRDQRPLLRLPIRSRIQSGQRQELSELSALSKSDPDRADLATETHPARVPAPRLLTNHNGGELAFGPETATCTSRRRRRQRQRSAPATVRT